LRGSETPLFYAKSKSVSTTTVYISKNPDIHMKTGQYEHVMTVDPTLCKFQVTARGSPDVVATIVIDNKYDGVLGPRKLDVDLVGASHLVSKWPSRRGFRWTLNFQGKYVVKSQKNAILLNQDKLEAVFVKKIDKNVLELEVRDQISEFHVFLIAVASFVCPL
jgi:hypothetical protein